MKNSLLTLVLAVCALTGAAQADISVYEPHCFTNLAGLAGTSGTVNGTGTAAQFNQPWGVAVDASGNVYVADTLNHTIRKITAAGVVTLLAGVPGTPGSANGANNVATFSRPTGVAVNGAGTVVLVADYNSHMVRQISGGSVTTLAGSGTAGTANATGSAAEFRNPFGVALNSAGTVAYVSDQNNQTIRAITIPGGVVTTLAGAAGGGYADGPNNTALFNTPRGIAVDAAGNVYVADSGNLLVRKITAGGFVTTLAGALFTPGFNDGLGSGSRFSILTPMSPFGGPTGVAVDGAGNVYVTDQGSTGAGHTIRKITPAGNVTTLAGAVGVAGSADGTGVAVGFNGPGGVAVDAAGKLYVADTLNHTIRVQCPGHCECVEKIFVSYNNGTIRQFDSAGVATTFATGLNLPKGLALTGGFLYVANSGANAILKFPTSGGASSAFSSSGLSGPYGIAFDGAGNLLVASYTSSTIQKLNGGTGVPIAPFPVTSGNMNGPFDVVADGTGNFYTTSHNNNTIQKFDSAGNFVSDFVPFTGGLSAPRGLAIKAGVLYVANYGISSIKTFDLTTGNALADFATTADGLLNPVGIAFDSAGHLFVANAGNNNVMKFSAAHVGSTFSSIVNQSPDFIAIGCESVGLNIALYPGLTITGSVGCQYRIEYTTFLNPNPNLTVWTTLTTLTLASSPFLYVDTTTPATGTRFYRAIPLP
jgi:sugar lactone lactonase YvrE